MVNKTEFETSAIIAVKYLLNLNTLDSEKKLGFRCVFWKK